MKNYSTQKVTKFQMLAGYAKGGRRFVFVLMIFP